MLSYIYVPFGELIMSYLSVKLAQEQHTMRTTSAEGAGHSPIMPISKRVGIKGDRLVNQMFACECLWHADVAVASDASKA